MERVETSHPLEMLTMLLSSLPALCVTEAWFRDREKGSKEKVVSLPDTAKRANLSDIERHFFSAADFPDKVFALIAVFGIYCRCRLRSEHETPSNDILGGLRTVSAVTVICRFCALLVCCVQYLQLFNNNRRKWVALMERETDKFCHWEYSENTLNVDLIFHYKLRKFLYISFLCKFL